MAICPECRKDFPDDVADCPEHGLALLPAALFTSEDTELEPTTRVGDYEVECKLGEGAFGRVYRAVQPIIGRRVAIKVLNRALSTDPHAVSRFIAEARAIVEVQSPHIVDVYSFGALDDGRQYYIMELLDGMDLEDYLRDHGALEVPVALRILAGMADALCAAHAADVVHRDIKPENVFIAFDKSGEPVPKLLDFGVAKLLGKGALGHRTSTGALVGTPAYMAPEQALGLEIDRRADIYAFGIVAFEMLIGKPPFLADSLVELVRMHTSEPPPAPSALRPELELPFDAAFSRLLQKDPENRPDTIEAAFAELRDAAAAAGHAVTLPTIVSLRPPPAEPSQPGKISVVGDAETVPAEGDTEGPRPAVTTETVGGTAGATTLTRQLSQPRSAAARWGVAAAALALVAGGAFAVARSTSDQNPPSAMPGSPVTAERTATVAAGVSARPADGTETVELVVETEVPGARVFRGDEDLGPVPGPFPLARGSTPIRLEVRAPDHDKAVLYVLPDQNRTKKPALEPRAGKVATPSRPRPGPVAPSASAEDEVPADLAVPGFAK